MTRSDKDFILTGISEQRAYAASFRGTSRFAVEARCLTNLINEAVALGLSPTTISRAAGFTVKGR